MSRISQRSNHARKNLQPTRRNLPIVTAGLYLFQDAVDENLLVPLNVRVLCVSSLARISEVFPRSAGQRRVLLKAFVPVQQRDVEFEPLTVKAFTCIGEEFRSHNFVFSWHPPLLEKMPVRLLWRHIGLRSTTVASTRTVSRRESPCGIVLIQLKRPFERRHHGFQFAWETKRTPQVLFDCGPGHDAGLRNQNSYIGAAVHDQNVLVQILDRCNDGVGHGSRLENRTDSVVDSRYLFRHRSSSPSTAAPKVLRASMSTRLSSPLRLIGTTLRQEF